MTNQDRDKNFSAEQNPQPELLDSLALLEFTLKKASQDNVAIPQEVYGILGDIRSQSQQLSRDQAQLTAICKIGWELAAILDLDDLLTSIMDQAIRLVGAERGMLILCRDGSDNDFDISLVRGMEISETEKTDDKAISQKMVKHVLRERIPVITTDAQSDTRFNTSGSIVALQIRSVLAVPLIYQQDLVGAIYLDTRVNLRPFKEKDLNVLSVMANQVAVAIRIAQLYDNLKEKNRELAAMVEELRETQGELIRSERLSAIGQMSSSIIHDIKGPLTAVKGFAQLLGRADLSEEQRIRISETICQSVDSFVGMTQEILDYARGQQTLSMESFDVKEFLISLSDFIERDFKASQIDVRVDSDYDRNIIGDRQKLWRAFFNIAKNAAEAMTGEKKERIFTMICRKSEDRVIFDLVDTGPGIPDTVRNEIFLPFATYGKHHGSGLGLSIAKSIVDAHQGEISFVTDTGKGTTFTVSLPAGEILND